LHIKDSIVLNYISKRLKIGKIYFSSNRNSVVWEVFAKEDIIKIIKIFEDYPLNTTKQLDFIAFKEAFYMYINKINLSKILVIKGTMNKQRKEFIQSPSHRINITNYWLLGFVEGDGSFYLTKKNRRLHFELSQTFIQKKTSPSWDSHIF
jgi:hypothetical protein